MSVPQHPELSQLHTEVVSVYDQLGQEGNSDALQAFAIAQDAFTQKFERLHHLQPIYSAPRSACESGAFDPTTLIQLDVNPLRLCVPFFQLTVPGKDKMGILKNMNDEPQTIEMHYIRTCMLDINMPQIGVVYRGVGLYGFATKVLTRQVHLVEIPYVGAEITPLKFTYN